MGNPFGPSHNSRVEVERMLTRRGIDDRDAVATFVALRSQIEAIESTPGVNAAVGAFLPFSNEVLYVQQLGYEGRNVIFLVGERAGSKVRLVFHHTQLHVMLVPVNSETEKRSKVLYIVPAPEESPPSSPLTPPEDG